MKPQIQNNRVEYAEVGELCDLRKGKKVKVTQNKTPNSTPYLLIDTLRGFEPEFFTEDKNYTEAVPEDILIVADGANSGLVGTGLNGAVGSTILRIRLNNKNLNKNYFSYFLKSKFEEFNKDMKGTGIPHLKSQKMLESKIRVPSKEEQTLIVQEIEKQFTRLDASVKALNSVKEKLEVYRKAVLKKAFEKKEGWEEIFVKDMGKIVTGKTPKTSILDYYGNEFCFFKPGDLDKGYFVNNSITKLSKRGLEILKELPEKSIMITCIGATIGKTGFNRVIGATNQQINSIIVDRAKFIPEFLYYLFISENGQRNIIDNSSSTTLPILNKSRFEKLSFFITLLKEEQTLIVQSIESKFSVIDKIQQVIDVSLEKAEKLRKSILKSAFEGKLVKMGEINEQR